MSIKLISAFVLTVWAAGIALSVFLDIFTKPIPQAMELSVFVSTYWIEYTLIATLVILAMCLGRD